MQTDAILADELIADSESILAMQGELEGMMTRLQEILTGPLTQDMLVEVMSIYNNAAYIFLHLEATDDHEGVDKLRPWHQAFYKDPHLDSQILAKLDALRCSDPEVESSRLVYIGQLRQSLNRDTDSENLLNEELTRAKELLAHTRREQWELLERLGAEATDGNPTAVFYLLISNADSAVTRHKLARAWANVRDKRQAEMVRSIDKMIDIRRHVAANEGYSSALARTQAACKVSEDDVAAFLERYLDRAIANHGQLQAEVRATVDVLGDPMDHFEFALRQASPVETPTFDLDECLNYIFAVAHSVFGLKVQRIDTSSQEIVRVRVWRGDTEVGQINFDLWDTTRKSIAANYTRGIRNRTDWGNLVQSPVAYVSCRFRRDQDGFEKITFQNVHGLFHEFGHAINHLLVRKRTSFQSGLAYLPPERLECLSMWFEKWVYHPEFGRFLSLPGGDESLAQCRRVKVLEQRRTYAERAVTAALDFDVHRKASGSISDSYRYLDTRFAISEVCQLGALLAYFTWPMYVTHPGANFTYLWGASFSSAAFLPFLGLTLAEIGSRPELAEQFAPCFDFDLPSHVPDHTAAFAFYDSAALSDTASGTAS